MRYFNPEAALKGLKEGDLVKVVIPKDNLKWRTDKIYPQEMVGIIRKPEVSERPRETLSLIESERIVFVGYYLPFIRFGPDDPKKGKFVTGDYVPVWLLERV